MTPCGAVVCTGCATCVTAWAGVVGLRLEPWQQRLVDAMFPPDPELPLDSLLERLPQLKRLPFRAVGVRAALMESA